VCIAITSWRWQAHWGAGVEWAGTSLSWTLALTSVLLIFSKQPKVDIKIHVADDVAC